MTRYASSIGVALLVTFSLFYLMQYLISGTHTSLLSAQGTGTFDIIRLKRSDDIITKDRLLPDPPTEPVAPKTLPPLAKSSNKPQLVTPAFQLPLPGIPSLDIARSLLNGVSTEIAVPGENSDVIALMKVEPDYPRKAAQQGIEGWVKLEFTVREDGTVADITVLDAEPKRVFEKSAKRTIERWKFKPRMVNGKAVQQRVSQVIEFKLAK